MCIYLTFPYPFLVVEMDLIDLQVIDDMKKSSTIHFMSELIKMMKYVEWYF